jgi:hypothetical protein
LSTLARYASCIMHATSSNLGLRIKDARCLDSKM